MPSFGTLLPHLIRDVESLIFSYITEVTDIVTCLKVNRSFRSKVPSYIIIIRGDRQPLIPCKFLLQFDNIQFIHIPVIMNTTVADLLTIVRRRHLLKISLLITLDIRMQLDGYHYLDVVCSNLANNNANITIQTCDSYKVSPQSRYRVGDFSATIDKNDLWITNTEYRYLEDLAFDIDTISKYRTIRHLSSPLELRLYNGISMISLSSLESYTWFSFGRSCLQLFPEILHFTNCHPNLREVGQDSIPVTHIVGPYDFHDLPIINRPFNFLMPVIPERIPLLLKHFPQLQKIALYMNFHDDFGYIDCLLQRGIECIIHKLDSLTLDIQDKYRNHPLVTIHSY